MNGVSVNLSGVFCAFSVKNHFRNYTLVNTVYQSASNSCGLIACFFLFSFDCIALETISVCKVCASVCIEISLYF